MELESTKILSWTWHHCDCNRGLEIYCKAQKHLKWNNWSWHHSQYSNYYYFSQLLFCPQLQQRENSPSSTTVAAVDWTWSLLCQTVTPFIHPFMYLSPNSVHTRALSLLLLLLHWVNMQCQDLSYQISPGKKKGKKPESSPDLSRK